MSWLFSRALVEEFWAATSWDGAPSAPLSVMPTPHKFWRNDKMMEPSRLSQFGLTCAVLREDHGAALLTSFLADFPVKTSQPRGTASESLESDLGFGNKWQESSVRYCLERSTWRTHHCLWEEDLPWCSVTLPRWGMTHGGELWEQLISTPPTSVIESGLWPAQVPGGTTDPRRRRWPTPVASASKGSSPAALKRKSGADRSNDRLDHAVMASDGGQLNPEWVEWLMGWPIGWTGLKPLGMDRFQEWLQQHTDSYAHADPEAA